LSIEHFKEIQKDLYSIQAEKFMKILSPVLSKNTHPYASVLKDWNLQYNRDSKGAYLFEQFYLALASEVVDLHYKNPNFAKFGI
jgi:penicillin amidase